MKAIIKRPGEPPELSDVAPDLKSMQAVVGGWLESAPKPPGVPQTVTVYCDEEGKLKGLEPNVPLYGDVLCGTILVVGFDEETGDNRDLTEAEIASCMRALR